METRCRAVGTVLVDRRDRRERTVWLLQLKRLGTTLKRRKADVLAYFDHVGSSSGPTEVLNGRFEHLRGVALGVRYLAHHFAQSLLETGGFRPAVRA